ncbi:hypothetical protein GCM10007884_15670 [Methylobacterium brachythecii]|uniref:Uncharacterized protein n=1 Tax=Methylobacterium brachythecii TaxID=1176177 RepID=A0ABQ6CZV2_9HYPH|nr:hypothetical protein GCM10007884_15670 [Methylobacterium brachythecii]
MAGAEWRDRGRLGLIFRATPPHEKGAERPLSVAYASPVTVAAMMMVMMPVPAPAVMMVVVMPVPDAVHEGRVVLSCQTGSRRDGSGLRRSDLETGGQDEGGEAAEKPCGHPYPPQTRAIARARQASVV